MYTAHFMYGAQKAPRFDVAATIIPASGPNSTAAKRIGINEIDASVLSLPIVTRCSLRHRRSTRKHEDGPGLADPISGIDA